MPVDSRRYQGPSSTVDYRVYSSTGDNSKEQLLKRFNTDVRKDGRNPDQHREISMKIGIISQAKGSAYIELNNTKVVCSVFDPREIPNKMEYSVNGELFCEFKFAPFSCKKRRSFMRDNDEREYSINLRRALEPSVLRHEFPNFQVDICVMVIENDGSVLPAAVTCASLALANAGVPMYDLVTAVSMGLYNANGIIDPTYEEEIVCSNSIDLNDEHWDKSYGIVTLSYLTTLQQITDIVYYGAVTSEWISKYIQQLTLENEKLYQLSRQCLVRGILKSIRNKGRKLQDN